MGVDDHRVRADAKRFEELIDSRGLAKAGTGATSTPDER